MIKKDLGVGRVFWFGWFAGGLPESPLSTYLQFDRLPLSSIHKSSLEQLSSGKSLQSCQRCVQPLQMSP